ncbi:PREDICTED: uncharacterized protein LOC109163037 [Ipomoea nil]|uniref:uncharacterized protein LOC109163037 n=1 Tax=Ipomoea nil TaxID=35883 RepID=UPI000900FFC0|nr:PREDICTED: uncharacterized protein LOC109163037 [Ipomoea nil]
MAVEMLQENPSSPSTISPRISFSHYLCQKENYPYYSDLNSDFDFCFHPAQTSSADELFSDGFILPFREKFVTNSKHLSFITTTSKPRPLGSSSSFPPLPKISSSQKQEISKESTEQQKSTQARPFWGIKRSSSLNCHKKGSFWSLPLLSRSNSTGSLRNSKQSAKEGPKGGQFRHIKTTHSSSSSFSSAYVYGFPSSQKPPLRKNHGGVNYGNGVRISPVINVTPPNCISVATVNLFGLGSLFRNGKDKKSGKK